MSGCILRMSWIGHLLLGKACGPGGDSQASDIGYAGHALYKVDVFWEPGFGG